MLKLENLGFLIDKAISYTVQAGVALVMLCLIGLVGLVIFTHRMLKPVIDWFSNPVPIESKEEVLDAS